MMHVDCIALGDFETNCYIIRTSAQSTRCLIIDPGFEPEPLLEFLRENRLEPEKILITHGHCDHIAGITELREAFPKVRVSISAADAPRLADGRLNLAALLNTRLSLAPADELYHGGETVQFEGLTFKVLPTPGHTPGCISFYCQSESVVFVGDLIFAGGIGRCDFPGGDEEVLLESVRREIFTLDENTRIYPGHGPVTTVSREKRTNPYFQ